MKQSKIVPKQKHLGLGQILLEEQIVWILDSQKIAVVIQIALHYLNMEPIFKIASNAALSFSLYSSKPYMKFTEVEIDLDGPFKSEKECEILLTCIDKPELLSNAV